MPENDKSGDERSWDRGFEGTRKRQLLNGSALSAAERVAWFYQMMLFLHRYRGAARDQAE